MDHMTEQQMKDAYMAHTLRRLQSALGALSDMFNGQLVPTIILRAPDNDAASVVVSGDKLPELADYLGRIRDTQMEPLGERMN